MKDYRVDLFGLGWSPLTSPPKHDSEPSDYTDLMFVDPCIIVQFVTNPTKCNSVSNILLVYIYMKLNMFRATHCPSSGA